ncbi:MAG: XkdF-like putative serine protease domain-containing protein, partial [Candidatus Neomarinimicrobiota bacterium]
VYDFMQAPMHDEMHERLVPTSKIVESFVVTDEKLQALFPGETIPVGKRGWWLGVYIPDPEVYAKHKAGIYTGFSITGTAQRKEV